MELNVAKKLKKLHQLEVDANHIYEECIERLRDPSIKTAMSEYKKDHEKHLDDIEILLEKINVVPPERSKDVKGLFLESLTALRSAISDDQALKAMRMNEELVYKTYEDTLNDIRLQNPEIDVMIHTALNDESKHYNYILSKLGHTTGYKKPYTHDQVQQNRPDMLI